MIIIPKIFVCLLLIATACQGSSKEQFLRANALYQQHEYQQALDIYQALGPKGPTVWYNMGNCAYNLQRTVDAQLFWQRAQRGATRQELADIAYNVDVLETQIKEDNEDGMHMQEQSVWQALLAWLLRCSATLPMLFLQLLILSLTLIMCILLRSALSVRYLVLVCLFVLYGAALVLLSCKIVARNRCVGIVTCTDAALFTGPDEQFHQIGTVPRGTRLVLEQERDGWCKAKHSVVGWIKKETMDIV